MAVRGVLAPHHLIMRDTRVAPIANALWSRSSDRDQFLLNSLKWVNTNIQYVEDINNQGQTEYVQMPLETVTLGIGDCEDFALLLAAIMLQGGVYDVRETLGWVHESHRWVEVKMSDGQWYVFDATNGSYFPVGEREARGYQPLWYVTPFSIQPAFAPVPPLFLPF